ncbi:hypothetical protein H0G86_012006 [Trichoderma simmonsii]|uniref:Uncharacterized protein n=1 Tax=Trichoderma simmonsii TaxID=1491479 RepID=A0A8G0LRN9_9HYPO|nr:hypothetical protein H0G86_012006 [Trichoderma simmonsii]
MPGNLIALKKWVQGDGEQQEHLCTRLLQDYDSFPLDLMTIIEKLSENMLVRPPNTDRKVSWLEVHLKERPTVKGFGMPFANPDHPSERFINHDAGINGKKLVDILQQESFHFVVSAPDQIFLKHSADACPDDEQDDVLVEWTARIQEASRGIDVLDCHPSDNNDLVLYVRKPREEDLKCDPISVKVFSDRTSATVALQKNKEH